uniref:Ig-like domain-containing protein n=1 Tax=Denticeps clupeoides TaxID=299321 RepID=A0AAY4AGN9_9TELE
IFFSPSLLQGEGEFTDRIVCATLTKNISQIPRDLILTEGVSSEIKCSHTDQSLTRMLWYKQTQAEGLIFLGYLVGDSGVPETAFTEKIALRGDASKLHGSLQISNLASSDTAVYFCAASQHSHAYKLPLFTKTW